MAQREATVGRVPSALIGRVDHDLNLNVTGWFNDTMGE